MGEVFAALDRETGSRVALKTIRNRSGRAIFSFKKEFRALSDLVHPNLVRLDELHVHDGRWFFTMELLTGHSFLDHVGGPEETPSAPDATCTLDDSALPAGLSTVDGSRARATDLASLRDATAQLLDGLEHLHRNAHLHLDIKPSNVFVTEAGRVVLLDFGLTQRMEGGSAVPTSISGSVSYMAPEQAAGRELTPATDLYAVGAMLYEALTGRPPFVGEATQVLAQKRRGPPVPASSRVEGVPAELDAALTALLDPEPSCRPGVAALRAALRIDATPRPLETAQFVGRSKELAQLQKHLDGSGIRALCVTGEGGVGKTALVDHALARLPADTWVLAGRCHPREMQPLQAVDGIVDALGDRLLSLPAGAGEGLLPDEPTVLVRVFPTLERVGPLAERVRGGPAEIPSPEVRRRAAGQLRQLLDAVADRFRLVLFVDDLHWIDAASAAFLGELLTGEPLDAAVVATSRLAVEALPIAVWDDHVETLTLGGLASEEATELARQSWDLDDEAARALVAETGGHPLWLDELGRRRVEGGAGGLTLAAALGQRIAQLDATGSRLLETVSLAGEALDLDAVVQATGLQRGACAEGLRGLQRTRLLRARDRSGPAASEPYHDRVREAVEARLDAAPDRRDALHWQLGSALLDRAPVPMPRARLFAVLRHLNQGAQTAPPERRAMLPALGLEGARAAIAATAYSAARAFAATGIGFLAHDPWSAAFDLCFDLHLTALQATYLMGEHEAAEALFAPLAERARPEDIGRLYEVQINIQMSTGRDAAALATARAGLARLEHPVPEAPRKGRVLWELLLLRRALRGRDPDDIVALPMAESPRADAVQLLLSTAFQAGFRVDQDAMAVFIVRGMRSILEDGRTRSAPGVLGAYGLLVGVLGRDRAVPFAWSQAARALCGPDTSGSQRALVTLCCSAFVEHWVRPYSEIAEALRDGYELGLRQGDELVSYACFLLRLTAMDLAGWHAETMRAAGRQCAEDNTRREIDNWASVGVDAALYADAMRHDRGTPPAPFTSHPMAIHDEDSLAACVRHGFTARLELHLGDADRALAAIDRAAALEHQIHGSGEPVTQRFVRALIAIRIAEGSTGYRRWRMLRMLRRCLRDFRGWHADCPENHAGRLATLEAAQTWLTRGPAHAQPAFGEALSRVGGHDELVAIASALWARSLEALDPEAASLRWHEAAAAWERCGASRMASTVRSQRGR